MKHNISIEEKLEIEKAAKNQAYAYIVSRRLVHDFMFFCKQQDK